MTIVPIVGFVMIAVAVLAVVRSQRPELAVLLALGAGATILLALLPRIAQVIDLIESLAGRGGVGSAYVTVVLKIIGIAYLAEFGAHVARDAGEGALAGQVEVAGRILILVLAIPVILAVLQLILKLLPEGAGGT